MFKKITAMLLALVMAAAVFAGCANNSQPGADTTQNPPAATGESKDDNQQTTDNGEPVSLRLILWGDPTERMTEFYKNEFHEKVLQDLNIDMTVDYLPWGSGSQCVTMAAAGEGFAFIAGPNSYPDLMAAGLYTVLDEDMIRELAPNYIAARVNGGFEGAKYNGEIVCLPMGYFITADADANIAIRNDILNEVGWDVSQITDVDTLNQAIAAVHAKYPDMKIIRGVENCLYKAFSDYLAPSGSGEIIRSSPLDICVVDESKPDSDQIISNFETEQFKNFCHLMKEWFDLGYLTIEDLTDWNVAVTAWETGNCLMNFAVPERIYDHSLGSGTVDADVQFLCLNKTPAVKTRDYVSPFLITKADEGKVESWLKFFDWVYASKENYLFCLWGTEGVDWNYDEYGDVQTVANDQYLYSWMMKTLYYEVPSTEKYDADEVEKYIHYDDSAILSKTIGFTFDQTPVGAEAAALNALITEKVQPFVYGIGDFDADFPAVLEELKAAGLDTYVAEYQRQFSEFMANK